MTVLCTTKVAEGQRSRCVNVDVSLHGWASDADMVSGSVWHPLFYKRLDTPQTVTESLVCWCLFLL